MPDAAAATEAAGAKSRSMLPVIIAAVVAALVAGGGGAYFALTAGKLSAAQSDAEEAKVAKAPPLYVKFDPPFVVNFEAKGLMRFLQVTIEVMTRDPATVELLERHDPVLRNDLLLLLGSQSYEKISTREGKEQLRKEALEAVAAVIAREGGKAKNVEELYFTSFVMQ